MLVINRQQEQTIHIDDQITITVLKTSGGRVKIGIDAPIGMRILRGELLNGFTEEILDEETGVLSTRYEMAPK
jgi:carbon storage regulator CsrA